MPQKTAATGVILAGGRATRMGNQDKGLLLFKGKPMVVHALLAMSTVVGEVLISANRNLEQYQQFGVRVLTDQTDSFAGPLAGIYTALVHCQTDILLVMPCDTPKIQAKHLAHMLHTLEISSADICVAFDGEYIQPVFLALQTKLRHSLKRYLASGQRKIDRWLAQHLLDKVDFSQQSDIFYNINTMDELSNLEAQHK